MILADLLWHSMYIAGNTQRQDIEQELGGTCSSASFWHYGLSESHHTFRVKVDLCIACLLIVEVPVVSDTSLKTL